MGINKLQTDILRALIKWQHDGNRYHPKVKQIAENLKIDTFDLQDQLDILESLGAIKHYVMYGSKSKNDYSIIITGLGKQFFFENDLEKPTDDSQQTSNTEDDNPIRLLKLISDTQVWPIIENEFGVTKKSFGKRINFVTDKFKRKIIFRDIEQAFVLASVGFSKPALILAGGVIEELLRLYLVYKNIPPISRDFNGLIKTCEHQGLLKSGITRLSDSVRHFRNLVHMSNENIPKQSISKATAKGAISSIFTISNDF